MCTARLQGLGMDSARHMLYCLSNVASHCFVFCSLRSKSIRSRSASKTKNKEMLPQNKLLVVLHELAHCHMLTHALIHVQLCSQLGVQGAIMRARVSIDACGHSSGWFADYLCGCILVMSGPSGDALSMVRSFVGTRCYFENTCEWVTHVWHTFRLYAQTFWDPSREGLETIVSATYSSKHWHCHTADRNAIEKSLG